MFRKIFKEFMIVLAVFAVGLAGFTALKLKPDKPEIKLPVETEQKVGELLADNILEGSELVLSDTVNQAVYDLKTRLLSSMEATNYDYKIHVLKDEQINAFATLGGHIFVYSGLIKITDSPEELAAVLAHEIGHVEKRHVVNKLAKEIGVSVIFSVLTGSDPVLVGELARLTVSSAFDRAQETEADQFALQTLEKARINPRFVSRIFRKLKEEYETYDERLEFLMSHPNLNKRIKESLEYSIPENFAEEPLELDWEAVKRNV